MNGLVVYLNMLRCLTRDVQLKEEENLTGKKEK